jgi:sugar phosphate isomerase/epimerase
MKVGIQLYSVRNAMAKDPIATLRQVVDCGYKYLETANYNADKDPGTGFGVSPREMNKILDDSGAKVVGAHMDPLDNLQPILDYFEAIGCKRIGIPMPFFKDLDDVKRQCDGFNLADEQCKARGFQLYYHNHYQEFQKFEGQTVLDYIYDNTQLYFEVDSFWAARGGVDPVALMEKLGSRLILLHQKDFSKNMREPINVFDGLVAPDADLSSLEKFDASLSNDVFTEIGTGILPIQDYINAGNKVGVEYIFLEQDHTKMSSEIESIKTSMESFKKFSGIEWA